MALIATATVGTDFKPVPTSVFIARCYRIVDLGTQRGEWRAKNGTRSRSMQQPADLQKKATAQRSTAISPASEERGH